jgi:hypothetical protein
LSSTTVTPGPGVEPVEVAAHGHVGVQLGLDEQLTALGGDRPRVLEGEVAVEQRVDPARGMIAPTRAAPRA